MPARMATPRSVYISGISSRRKGFLRFIMNNERVGSNSLIFHKKQIKKKNIWKAAKMLLPLQTRYKLRNRGYLVWGSGAHACNRRQILW